MWRIFVLMMSLVPLTPAFAGNVTKELRGYNGLTVSISETAAKCNLTDSAVFSDYMGGKLDELGLKDNPNSKVHVVLGISGTTFGLLGAQCVTHTQLSFNVLLRADNIVTDNQTARAAIDRLGTIPIRLWSHSAFGIKPLSQPAAGGKSLAAYDAVKNQIDLIVARFKKSQNE